MQLCTLPGPSAIFILSRRRSERWRTFESFRENSTKIEKQMVPARSFPAAFYIRQETSTQISVIGRPISCVISRRFSPFVHLRQQSRAFTPQCRQLFMFFYITSDTYVFELVSRLLLLLLLLSTIVLFVVFFHRCCCS